MGIHWNADGSATIAKHYRRPDGSKTSAQVTVLNPTQATLFRAGAELCERVEGGSLKIKFARCIAHKLDTSGDGGNGSAYRLLTTELGGKFVDKKFVFEFQKFISRQRKLGKAQNTIANYSACCQAALRAAERDGLIESVPVKDFDTRREFRERVWTEAEAEKIFAAAQRSRDRGLFWRIYFAAKNPVRKSDLATLPRDALKLVGPNTPYVKYYPRKTRKNSKKPAFLAELDADLLEFFADTAKRFPDCLYLFPGIYQDAGGESESWRPAGDFKKAWSKCLERAGVTDFHLHDLKHVAITYMLGKPDGAGHRTYTRDSLKKLGIQHSDRSIDVYDQTKGMDELARVRGTKAELKIEPKEAQG